MPTTRLSKAAIDRLNAQALADLAAERARAGRRAARAREAALAIGHRRGVARAELIGLWLTHQAGQPVAPACLLLQQQCLAEADPEGAMACTVLLGAATSAAGQLDLAARHFVRARALASGVADSLHKVLLYNQLGLDALHRGDCGRAARSFLLALDGAARFGSPAHRVEGLTHLAAAQHDAGNHHDALPLLHEALQMAGAHRLAAQRAAVSARLAMCLLGAGRADQALALLQPFCAGHSDRQDQAGPARAFLLCLAAHAALLLGRLEQAAGWLTRGQAEAARATHVEPRLHGWLVRGMLCFLQQRPGPALRALTRAHGMLDSNRNAYFHQHILNGLATVHARLGMWQLAYRFSQQYQSQLAAVGRGARDARLMMRALEKEIRHLRAERDRALASQAARESDNRRLRNLNLALSHQILHAHAVQDGLKQQALRDHLTGLYNRRHFEASLDAMLAEGEAEAGGDPIAVVMLDLDLFKRVNDSYGHPMGDAVLVAFARLVESQLRTSDMVCRYGGEEFCLLLRGADSSIAAYKMDDLAWRYRQLVIQQGGQSLDGCTFSAGIAHYPHHGGQRAALLAAADQALYAAKQAGRARVALAPAPGAAPGEAPDTLVNEAQQAL
ncbi:MAG: GGDEF domain-containing protein [Pseudomonadota bacterium]